MEATNDPELLKNSSNCDFRCDICFKSLCYYDHERWKCICGHGRGYHLSIVFDYCGYWTIPNHPHPCGHVGCDCQALWYEVASDLISDEEAIQGLYEVIQDLDG